MSATYKTLNVLAAGW